MAAEGMRVDPEDLIVTTGGQQVIDLVTKTLIDPGDVVIAEGPTYPGAVPVFSSYQADVVQMDMDSDGMRVDLLEETLDRLERDGPAAEVHLHRAELPEPGRRDDVAGTPAGGSWRWRTSASCSCSRTTRTACSATRATPPTPLLSLDGGVYVMYLGTFSKILSPGIRLGWVVAPPPVLEKINLGKQAADLCTSTLSQLMVQAYFEESRWRDYVESLTEIYRARRDTMLDALAEHFPRQAEWTRPAGGLFIWATLPDFIDTTDLLARALRDNVAFVPGEAAFLDGRGRNSMRLNFSGSDEDAIREGIRRIGEVVTEQVELYGTLTGERPAVRTDEPAPADDNVLRLPERAERERRARGS